MLWKSVNRYFDIYPERMVLKVWQQSSHRNGQTWQQIDLKTSKTIVALDEIADPGNLGTIIRTADASGVTPDHPAG